MKKQLLIGLIISLGMGVTSSLFANTVVKEIDEDTLRVVRYKGKPPYQRLTLSRSSNPELFAHYAELIDYDPQPLFASRRSGAPGKSLPRQAQRVSADPVEIIEFARFEETQEKKADTRLWRGAPGKGRPIKR